MLLLQASAHLFARHGYQGVSLDAVAEEAGFSKGAVYSNFSSKQDLLASLLEMHCEQQLAQVRSILDEPMSLDERIGVISAAYFGSSDGSESWCLLFTELWIQAVREPSLRPRLARLYGDTRDAVAEMIRREAQRLGMRLVLPAEEVAQGLLALGDGLTMQHVVAPSERTAKAYGSALRALFQTALRQPDEEKT